MNQQLLTKLISSYPQARKANQLLIIIAQDSFGQATLFQNYPHCSMQRFHSPCRTSSYGLGKQKEGDRKTPLGLFTIGPAFGIFPDPGTQLLYTQLTSSHYWVNDPKSRYYNQLVSQDEIIHPDWNNAKCLFKQRAAYAYAVSL